MSVEIITKEDLIAFRHQLLEDIKRLVQPQQMHKEVLRSKEVRKILKISPGTLQNYRINGTLHPTRMPNSKIWYYSADEINGLLQKMNIAK